MTIPKDHQRDAQFIQTPMEWPRWPLLPLKRRKGSFHQRNYLGFLLDATAPPYRVYVAVMYGLPEPTKGMTWADALKGIEAKNYTTLETLVAEWRVD